MDGLDGGTFTRVPGSVLTDGSREPDGDLLSRTLGKTKPWWDAVVTSALKRDGVVADWKFYGAKHGWQCKLTRRSRAVLYLIPKDGGFTAAMALDEEGVRAVRASKLPAALIRAIVTAKTYAEGRPARVEVKAKSDVAAVERLLAIKLAL